MDATMDMNGIGFGVVPLVFVCFIHTNTNANTITVNVSLN
jgi:hypothetical protein